MAWVWAVRGVASDFDPCTSCNSGTSVVYLSYLFPFRNVAKNEARDEAAPDVIASKPSDPAASRDGAFCGRQNRRQAPRCAPRNSLS